MRLRIYIYTLRHAPAYIYHVVQAHLRRLYSSAKALKIHLDVTPRQMLGMLRRTLDVNGMREASGVHIRLVVSRGRKTTPCQDPRLTIGHPTIVIIPDWKKSSPEQAEAARSCCSPP